MFILLIIQYDFTGKMNINDTPNDHKGKRYIINVISRIAELWIEILSIKRPVFIGSSNETVGMIDDEFDIINSKHEKQFWNRNLLSSNYI